MVQFEMAILYVSYVSFTQGLLYQPSACMRRRVTVVVCVCLSVFLCVCLLSHILPLECLFVLKILSGTPQAKSAPLRRSSTCSVESHTYGQPFSCGHACALSLPSPRDLHFSAFIIMQY